jgi:putative transposase
MGATAQREVLPTIWRIPDDLWLIVRHVLPREELQRSRGRPWIDPRRIVDGVLFVLRTGCQWKAVPREFGSGSTVHRRFQRWVEQGVWEAMWQLLLQYYDAAVGLEWTWQSADTSLHKAPLGGEKNGPQPDGPGEVGDQAPHPHRRRRRADRHHDHRGEHA